MDVTTLLVTNLLVTDNDIAAAINDLLEQNKVFIQRETEQLSELTKGTSTDNLRIHIDVAWRKRCRPLKFPR